MFIIIKQIKEKILKSFQQMYENSYCTIKNYKNMYHRLDSNRAHFLNLKTKIKDPQKYKLHSSCILLHM